MITFAELWDKYPRRAPSKGNRRKAEAHYIKALDSGATPEFIAEQLDKHIQSQIAVGNCKENGKGYVANQYMMQAETFFSTGWEREFATPEDAAEDHTPLTPQQVQNMKRRGYVQNAVGQWRPIR